MGLLGLAKRTPEVDAGTLVAEAVRVMVEAKVGAIAIVDGRKIVGVFTERDLMRRVVHAGRDPAATRLRDVMTTPVQTVVDETSVPQAATLMRTHHIRHLAVVDGNGDYLGMVALRYLLYDIMAELEKKVGDLNSWVMADAPGG
jgi:CBS domain-containing protein